MSLWVLDTDMLTLWLRGQEPLRHVARLIRAALGFREPCMAGSADTGGSRHVPPLENVD